MRARWQRLLRISALALLNVGIVVLLRIQVLHAYKAARERHWHLDSRLAQYTRIVQQIKAGELKIGSYGKVSLPPLMAGATPDGCVYVGHIDDDHGARVYLFPVFIRMHGKEVAGYLYVDQDLPVSADLTWISFGDYVSGGAIEAVSVDTNFRDQGDFWFRTGWFTQVYMPPLRKGPAFPGHAHWYFAQPFYDD